MDSYTCWKCQRTVRSRVDQPLRCARCGARLDKASFSMPKKKENKP